MEWRTSRRACERGKRGIQFDEDERAYDFVAVLGVDTDAAVKGESAAAWGLARAKVWRGSETHAFSG